MKILQMRKELFHSDGWTDGRKNKRTDMTKLIVAFRHFAKVPKAKEKQTHTPLFFYVRRNLQKKKVAKKFRLFTKKL